jgi:prepilin peptidase CpaA
MPLPTLIALVLFVVGCCARDLSTRRIPNALCCSGMVLGLALNGAYFGIAGITASIAGILLLLVILLAPFAAGGIGGGDVKMMAAVGALVGPKAGVLALTTGMVFGGIVTVAHLARLGRVGEKFRATGERVRMALRDRSVDALVVSPLAPDAVALPYSLPLGLGTLTALLTIELGRRGL